jgi:hypothetical protein
MEVYPMPQEGTLPAGKVLVTVYHNDLAFTAALPKLRQVFTCVVDADTPHPEVLEKAFEVFNIGDPETSQLAWDYRSLGLRSLSVSDVVKIGSTAYRCDSFGWSPVE